MLMDTYLDSYNVVPWCFDVSKTLFVEMFTSCYT
jgi:hypothetical protein